MKDYISINQAAYDATAPEFQAKKRLRSENTAALVRELSDYLDLEYPATDIRVLELGPGSGYAAKLLCDRGYQVTTIEFSEPMARLAQITAPAAELIVDEFMSHDFKGQKFNAIFAVAFIHLFTRDDAETIVRKMYQLLSSGGIALVSTTQHEVSCEGYAEKTNFHAKSVRFRRFYSQEDFIELLSVAPFQPLKLLQSTDTEVEGRQWMGYLLKRE
ncbi:MAG: class I SAM-dependent methyltransferase [Candidatus Saccharimonadales bacterium]